VVRSKRATVRLRATTQLCEEVGGFHDRRVGALQACQVAVRPAARRAAVAPLLAVLYALMGDVAPQHMLTESYGWETTGVTSGIALGSALAGVGTGLIGTSLVFALAGATMLGTSRLLAVRAETLHGHPPFR